VLVDRQNGLVLTSWELVRPYRVDGSLAYTRLLAGPAAGSSGRPEYTASLVAANPRFDVAVIRLGAMRDGAQAPSVEAREAVLADSNSLRRGDRIRMLVQPAADRGQPLQVTNAAVAGFAADQGGESRAWLKTDARVSSMALGGPVFDQSGLLVGFATQLAYDPTAPVALARPLARAIETLNEARGTAANTSLRVAPQRSVAASGAVAPAKDGAVVSRPVFAENALQGPGFRELFDYKTAFRADIPELNYEFLAQGVPQGALVQELWYLNGVLQDALSSSYNWTQGTFGVVSDHMTTPNARGIPNGRWTLEVWVAGSVRATSTVYVGIAQPAPAATKPTLDGFRFASTATSDQAPGGRISASAQQLLAFFNYKDAGGSTSMRWVALRDGRTMYQSTPQPWTGGSQGSWWVGVSDPNGIGAGTWDFQLYFDDVAVGSARTEVR
jgi:S1-C subfamily serine protease